MTSSPFLPPRRADQTDPEGQDPGPQEEHADVGEIEEGVRRSRSGEATDRNPAGMRIAAIGTPDLAGHLQNGERAASSTSRSMTSERIR